ncbi:MAG: ABC transporter substrate-binding protein, partial [Actinobacteria bacterium]|nr:ABC transporter substrate-binding protein [Actinomycetota bacterium]
RIGLRAGRAKARPYMAGGRWRAGVGRFALGRAKARPYVAGGRWRAGVLCMLVAALTVAAAACGGSGDEAAPAPEPAPATTAGEDAGGGGETAGGEVSGGGEPGETAGPGGEAAPGGVYRVDWEASFNFTNGFDPTGEYLGEAFGIYSSLLIRTLVGYRHTAGPAGNELIPDLATDLGEVSADGLTYTFRLKDGIKFGPPLSREITSRDVEFAFERIGTKSLVAQYGLYYDVIQGMAEFRDEGADDITGIETPDEKTIVFHLTEPTGDFSYRLGMPATGPMPEEVAGCFDEAGAYGRYVISSGPYMLEGSEALDATSCETLEPISGFDAETAMTLVRNPDYDPTTDTPEARENLVDRFELRVNTNNDDIFNRVKAGEIDDEIATEPAKVLKEYSENAELAPMLHTNLGDRTWYITMNLTQPPFDDIRVRKAVNLVLDKIALRVAWGGPLTGEIATHIVPDPIFNDELEGYDPYPSPEHRGDIEAALAEIAQSKYDTDGDGVCDAPECKDVLHITGDTESRVGMIPIIEDGLGKIGITLETRSLADSYTAIQDASRNVPISSQPGWGKDYADASTFFAYLFDGRTLLPTGNSNYSLVGLTPEKAQEIGATGSIEGVPSVDTDLDACKVLSGDERRTCYEDLDRKLMEEIVPWVPYLWSSTIQITGPAVTKWDYDQFSGTIAYAHVAVDPSRQ